MPSTGDTPAVFDPDEIAQFLLKTMKTSNGVKQSDRVHAAAGLMQYILAAEISSLIRLLINVPTEPEE